MNFITCSDENEVKLSKAEGGKSCGKEFDSRLVHN
jgi:hypothetical protein